MLGKIGSKRRKGWQRIRRLDSITDSMDTFEQTLRDSERTGKSGVLAHGPQGVGHELVTEQQHPYPLGQSWAVGHRGQCLTSTAPCCPKGYHRATAITLQSDTGHLLFSRLSQLQEELESLGQFLPQGVLLVVQAVLPGRQTELPLHSTQGSPSLSA